MNQQDDLEQYNHLTMTHPKQHVVFWLLMLGLLGLIYVFAVDIPRAIRSEVYTYFGVEE